jgi:HK97 family phage major capsid protein
MEIEKIRDEIVQKTTEKVLNELNSKFITYEEMQKAIQELLTHKETYSIEAGVLTKNIKAMVEGTGSAGGYLVPPEYVDRILDVAIQEAVVYPKVTRIPVASNQAYLTGVSTAVSFSYPGEATAPTPTAPTLTQQNVPIKKGMALIDISNELLADATIGGAVDAYLVRLLGRAYGKEMDRLILVGDTSKGDPFNGILNTSGITTVVAPSGNTTTIPYDTLVDATLAIPADYKLNPFWIAHRAFYGLIRKIKTTYNQPIFDPEAKTILGYDYAKVEVMPSEIAAGQPVALFADPSNVLFGMRNDLQITVSKEAKFAQDLTELRATFRFAFVVAYPQTFVVIKTSAT